MIQSLASTRRMFMLASSAAGAFALLPRTARAAQIAENDSRIITSRASYKGATGTMTGYLARPTGGENHGAVLVVHARYGLTPHMEDVARRLAVQGYVALSPDFLAPDGGTPQDAQKAIDMIMKSDAKGNAENAKASIAFLRAQKNVNGKAGAIGFCFGGTVVNRLAAIEPTLNAAVPYYGNRALSDEVANIRAPLLIHYADPKLDPKTAVNIPLYEADLKKNGKAYTQYIYEGAKHAFNDDTNLEFYSAPASALSWSRTLAFLKTHVG